MLSYSQLHFTHVIKDTTWTSSNLLVMKCEKELKKKWKKAYLYYQHFGSRQFQPLTQIRLDNSIPFLDMQLRELAQEKGGCSV